MTDRAIQEGLVDCPRFGIMDEQRCIPSCEYHESKDESRVDCSFGESLSGAATAEGDGDVSKKRGSTGNT
jgi:hypothetical protein